MPIELTNRQIQIVRTALDKLSVQLQKDAQYRKSKGLNELHHTSKIKEIHNLLTLIK